MIRDLLCIPENSDRSGILRKYQPAGYIAGQAVRLDRICRYISYPVKDILSVFIGVTSALIGGKKMQF